MRRVDIFTDGACRGNPGPGGWGVLMRAGSHMRELYGGEPHTTNNRMEMTAVIEALSALKKPAEVVITTDSQYVRKGITEWIEGWKRRKWLTASRQPVKNVELWQRIDELAAGHRIDWRWVKGHSGHAENERVDALANRGIDEMIKQAGGGGGGGARLRVEGSPRERAHEPAGRAGYGNHRPRPGQWSSHHRDRLRRAA